MPRTKFVKGIEVPDFDHTTSDLYTAIGYTDKEVHDLVDRYNALVDNIHGCTSRRFEIMINNFTPLEICILTKLREIEAGIR